MGTWRSSIISVIFKQELWKTSILAQMLSQVDQYQCEKHDQEISHQSKLFMVPNKSFLLSRYPSACTLFMETKLEAAVNIFPAIDKNKECTLMLFTNLAAPEWIPVNCSRKMIHDFFCKIQKVTNASFSSAKNFEHRTQLCSSQQIRKHEKCFLFVWNNPTETLSTFVQLCRNHRMKHASLEMSEQSKSILQAVSEPVSAILFIENTENLHKIEQKRYLYSYVYEKHLTAKDKAEGYYICVSDKKKIKVGSQLFRCADGMFISQVLVCDGNRNCVGHATDEFCITTNTKRHHMNSACPSLHYETAKGSCQKFLLPKGKTLGHLLGKQVVRCRNGIELDMLLKNDLVPDCGPDAEDEPILLSSLSHNRHFTCKRPYEIPCKSGHSKCFNMTDICVYSFDIFNHLHPCRTGGHLEQCDTFQCNMMFKCFNSYCIPWSYSCDGKWDCPNGKDELFHFICRKDAVCPFLYSCRNSRQCIHVGTVCDNTSNCPSGDDEEICQLKNHMCPVQCHCLLFAIKCWKANDLGLILHQLFYPHMLIDTSFSIVQNVKTIFERFPLSMYVIMIQARIQYICQILSSGLVVYLDVSLNAIGTISKNCMESFFQLKYFNISDNKILSLSTQSFVNTTALQVLCLSNNPLEVLPHNVFKDSLKLQLILARNLSLKQLDKTAFDVSFPVILNVTDYRICCVAPSKINCTSEIFWDLWCTDILPAVEIKVCFVLDSVLIFGLSCVSVSIHLWGSDASAVFNSCVVSINITDILLVTYLCIVWIADATFKGTFFVKEKMWRSGSTCFAACQLVLWFALASQFTLCFFSLSRMMVVINPVDTKFKKTMFGIKCLSVLFLAALLSSVAFVIAIKFTADMMPNPLCLPFFDPPNLTIAVKIVTWFIASITIATPIAVTIMHVLLIKYVLKSDKNIRKSKTDNTSNVFLIAQLAALNTSHILCWFSSAAVFLAAMFSATYPMDLVRWTTVAILPVNSVICPATLVGTFVRKYLSSKQKQGNDKSLTVPGTPQIMCYQ